MFAELKQSRHVLPEVVPRNTLKARVVELALSACTHVEYRTKGIPCRQFQDVRVWVAWIGEHLPHAILQLHRPRIVAARVLHAAWCMEFGDGFQFAEGVAEGNSDVALECVVSRLRIVGKQGRCVVSC